MLKTLIYTLSDNKTITRFLSRHGMSSGFARRFVAGETLEDAVRTVKELNGKGIPCSLNFLGEHVKDRQMASSVVESYLAALDGIQERQLDSNLSVKPSQLGLDIDFDFCLANLQKVMERAERYGLFVRIDMEGSEYTARTLDLHRTIRSQFSNVGTVIQSMLRRSEGDIRDLNGMRSRVRLVKGAYKEPPAVAYQKKSEVDEWFRKLTETLLKDGVYPALATQDPAMIDHAKSFSLQHRIPKENFEFQMILGVRRDLQESLKKEGYGVRVYVPFGKQWLPYFMRRLAERPANILFILRNLLAEK
jgi:proline dehydrogenase